MHKYFCLDGVKHHVSTLLLQKFKCSQHTKKSFPNSRQSGNLMRYYRATSNGNINSHIYMALTYAFKSILPDHISIIDEFLLKIQLLITHQNCQLTPELAVTIYNLRLQYHEKERLLWTFSRKSFFDSFGF